ncbi:MAG: hypothetical protein HY243_17380 [Proteobacteria bacterium]|nr:hypothetical protein [Pseudomonadota bacterium]
MGEVDSKETTSSFPSRHFIIALAIAMLSTTLALMVLSYIFPGEVARPPIWALPIMWLPLSFLVTLVAGIPTAIFGALLLWVRVRNVLFYLLSGALTGEIIQVAVQPDLVTHLRHFSMQDTVWVLAGAIGGTTVWLYLRPCYFKGR